MATLPDLENVMRKVLLTVLVTLFLSVSAQSYFNQEELIEQQSLNAKAIASFTLREIDLELNFGEVIEKDESWIQQSIFDSQGNIIEFNSTTPNHESNTLFKYDGQSLIETESFRNEGLVSKIEYVYDSQGNRIETLNYNANGELTTKSVSVYNTQGNQIETLNYNAEGTLVTKYIYEYDAQGNQVSDSTYDSTGKIFEKRINKYDAQGNRIEQALYGDTGNLWAKTTFVFDSRNNLTEETEYAPDEDVSYKYTYAYDENNNVIEAIYTEIYSGEEATQQKTIYKYDDWNNQIYKAEYDESDSQISQSQCDYIGDTHSNWVERTCFPYKQQFGEWQPVYDGWQKEKTIRVIEYLE